MKLTFYDSKYQSILKLKELLESANIDFEFRIRDESKYGCVRYQILYPVNNYVISVVEGFGTLGSEVDSLEIQDLTHESDDEVTDWLTCEEVFTKIKQHHDANACSCCDFTNTNAGKSINTTGDSFVCVKQNNEIYLATDDEEFKMVKINYCPFCGRQL